MAIWGPNAVPAEPDFADTAPPVPARALRWYDLVLFPAGGLLAAIAVAGLALLVDRFVFRTGFDVWGVWVPDFEATWFAYTIEVALYAGFLLTGIVLLRMRGLRLSDAYFPPIRLRSLLAAGGLGAIFAGLFMWLLSLLPAETQQELMEKSELLSPSTAGEALTLLFVAVLLAPIAEELYFRGVMFRLLSERVPFLASGGLTAILFSLTHGHLFILPGLGGWVLTILLFVIGFLFAALARLTGSLRSSTVMHGVYNAVLLGPGVIAAVHGTPV